MSSKQDPCSTQRIFQYSGKTLLCPEIDRTAAVAGRLEIRDDFAIRRARADARGTDGCGAGKIRRARADARGTDGVEPGKIRRARAHARGTDGVELGRFARRPWSRLALPQMEHSATSIV